MLVSYKGNYVKVVSPIKLEHPQVEGTILAVEYQDIKKMPSCLVGYQVLSVVTFNYESYLIVKCF